QLTIARRGFSSHLRQRAVAVRGLHVLAGPLGDVFPVMGVVVDGRGAGAGRAGAGGAVVLAGERDAVALVGAGLRGGGAGLGGGGERARERSGEGGGGEGGLGVHVRQISVFWQRVSIGRGNCRAGLAEPLGPASMLTGAYPMSYRKHRSRIRDRWNFSSALTDIRKLECIGDAAILERFSIKPICDRHCERSEAIQGHRR